MGCVRPPGTLLSRRFRRRGPRSQDALFRRRRRQRIDVSPVLPQSGGPCQSGPDPLFLHDISNITIFHCNLRGFITNSPELEARLILMEKSPSIVCITETWLNSSIGSPSLYGYIIIGRRDRSDGRIGGGVIIFAHSSVADAVSTVFISTVSERIWCILYSSFGPLLLCAWYRPLEKGEIYSITSFVEEYDRLRSQGVSSIICGDFNVHQKSWLIHSRENTPEGSLLEAFAAKNGFAEMIKKPTRGNYLLDLFLTDFTGAFYTDILPCISDHKCTQTSINMNFVLFTSTSCDT